MCVLTAGFAALGPEAGLGAEVRPGALEEGEGAAGGVVGVERVDRDKHLHVTAD